MSTNILDLIPRAYGFIAAKRAADAELSYGLSGRLYLSSSGFILLSVPNAFAQGCFQAISAPGAELPTYNGRFNAHISVMRPEEVESLGGPDKITERGKLFRYTLGPTREVNPSGWSEMERCWFVEVHSPELERLRKSYGLTARPNSDKYKFHITFAVRRKGVLRDNDVVKISSAKLEALLEAKRQSDRKNYAAKQQILQTLISAYPEEFVVSQPNRFNPGITHTGSNFKIHTTRALASKVDQNQKRLSQTNMPSS